MKIFSKDKLNSNCVYQAAKHSNKISLIIKKDVTAECQAELVEALLIFFTYSSSVLREAQPDRTKLYAVIQDLVKTQCWFVFVLNALLRVFTAGTKVFNIGAKFLLFGQGLNLFISPKNSINFVMSIFISNLKPTAMTQKKIAYFFYLLLFVVSGSAQIIDKDIPTSTTTISAKEIEKLPFSRGINNFNIQQNFGYNRTKPENSDNHSRQIGLNLDYNRFIVDGFAVGAELDLSSIRTEINNIDVVKSTEVMLYGNAIYGHTFSSGLNLYGKASVGFGSSKTKYTNFPTDESDLFGYKLEIGSPIHLFNGGGNYITPFISYNFLQQKDDGAKYKVNGFDFGFRFENYSPCSAYQCDCKRDRRLSKNMYEQGRSLIGYTSTGDYGFGSTKSEPGNNETDISGGSFNLEYGYYITRDIALGAGLSWSGSTEKDDFGKTTSSALSLMPMITLNAPTKDCFENFFLQAGYGFGFDKTKIGSTEYKYNTSNLCINLGFNHFFGKYLAFTPKIGHEWETFKNTDTNAKNKQSGFEFGFGCSLHF
jgi:Outer membrane protein beta-barrel domain/TonB-dependent Receptor Plug Domain